MRIVEPAMEERFEEFQPALIADTVVSSCRNASTAHDVALAVSLARGVA